jgi:hypothetical protein
MRTDDKCSEYNFLKIYISVNNSRNFRIFDIEGVYYIIASL